MANVRRIPKAWRDTRSRLSLERPVNHNLLRLEAGLTTSIDSDAPLPEHTLQQNLQERVVEPEYIPSDHTSNAIPSVVRKTAV
jgi:hypothetical protein